MLASIRKVKELMKLIKKEPDLILSTKVDFGDQDGMSGIEKSLAPLGFHLDRKCLKRRNTIFNFVGPAGVVVDVNDCSGSGYIFGWVKIDPGYPFVPRPPKEMTIKVQVDDWKLTEKQIAEAIASRLPKKLGIRVK